LTNEFMDEFFSKGFFPLIDKPFRISSSATLLDNIWTNNLTCEITSAIVTDSISDHFGIFQFTMLSSQSSKHQTPRKLENSIILI